MRRGGAAPPLLLLSCLCTACSSAHTSEWFEEALTLRPLRGGALLAFANFSVAVEGRDWRHLGLFPRAVAELLLGSGALEVHLSLSSGRWLEEEWGSPPTPVPQGAAAWAWVPAASGPASWARVLGALATLVCSRVGHLATSSVSGVGGGGDGGGRVGGGRVGGGRVGGGGAYHPPAQHLHRRRESPWAALEAISRPEPPPALELHHASDPREGVCTENLGSWMALSPCGNVAGLGALLGIGADEATDRRLGRAILSRARYTSLRLRVLTECAAAPASSAGASPSGRCRPETRLSLAVTAVLPGRPTAGVVPSGGTPSQAGEPGSGDVDSNASRGQADWMSHLFGAGDDDGASTGSAAGADTSTGSAAGAGTSTGSAAGAGAVARESGGTGGVGLSLGAGGTRQPGLHACPLSRHSVVRLELAAACHPSHEAALAAFARQPVRAARVWPSAFGEDAAALLLGGGVATAEWPLPRAPAPPLVLALDTWPLPPPEAGEAGSHRGTWHPPVTARRAVAGATDRHGSLLLEVRSPLGRLAHSYLPKTSQNLLTIA